MCVMQVMWMSLWLAAPADVMEFTLTWDEQAAGTPLLHEELTVTGEEVSYKRTPTDEPQRALVKRPSVVRELLTKLPARKAKGKTPLRAVLKTSAKTIEYAGSMPVKADDKVQTWIKLRDELRVSLGLIPDSAVSRPTSVGVATLQTNGELWMRLHSAEPGMPVAEALQIVKPDDPRYATYLEHLGGLKPGESKSIPPFD